MKYMLLIYENEKRFESLSEAEREKIFKAHMAFIEGAVKTGNFKAGDALLPTTTATTVKTNDGKTVTTDGPFAETREQLGGYYLIEAKDLDEAVALAKRLPEAKTGSVEVRPVMVFEQPQ